MAKLILESQWDSLSLNAVEEQGYGIQAQPGTTGLGLPPVSPRWLEGAGDGAKYRGTRALPRDIDIPLKIVGRNRADLMDSVSRLSRMLSHECTLRMVQSDASEWTTKVVRSGGGDYAYGANTISDTYLELTLSLRSGDPYWTSAKVDRYEILGVQVVANPFVSNFMQLPMTAAQAPGDITWENTGDAHAFPLWEVHGPGKNFQATSWGGEVLRWEGSLEAGKVLYLDTRTTRVWDSTGVNRYDLLAAAPKFWTVPPGGSTAKAVLEEGSANSRILCSWQTRNWMVI
ncbi:hypothetical protein [Actinocorallia libanotica]|uniref:Minor tail protein n=1 Tax=Actinocorallia libanotica TaxID=46162 RepID=A0ABP4CEA1_9ACTN